jgi:F-type H+-transporting ATPase subunit epsilon
MADLQVELVSPERRLDSLEADVVELPGSDGDFSAMPGHVPTATTLRPGVVKIRVGSNVQEYVIAGGFAEITAESVSIMAERASPREEATKEMFAEVRADAEAKVAATEGLMKAEAERELNEIDGLQRALSL